LLEAWPAIIEASGRDLAAQNQIHMHLMMIIINANYFRNCEIL